MLNNLLYKIGRIAKIMVQKNGERLEYTSVLEDFLRDSEEFQEGLDIARRNSQNKSKIWLIGSYNYGHILNGIYGEIWKPKLIDMDFLMENASREKGVYIPKGWTLKVSENYGNNYLLSGDSKARIDLNYLKSFHPILSRKLRPRLRHFFTTTPLDIQSIACDVTGKCIRIMGWRGIEAIKRKVVRINNLEEAKYVAGEIMKISVEDLVRMKAEELGFGYNTNPMITDYRKTMERLGNLLGEEQTRTEGGLDVLISPGPKKED